MGHLPRELNFYAENRRVPLSENTNAKEQKSVFIYRKINGRKCGGATTTGAIKQSKGFKNKVFPKEPGLIGLTKVTFSMKKCLVKRPS